MNVEFLFGVLLGVLAALMLNLGKGVQKLKVRVFLQGRRMFSKKHRGDLTIWVLGFLMTAAAAVPYSIGLMLSKSPSTVSAMTGVGLIGLSIFAVLVIGEKLRPRDWLGILLVVVGTSVLASLGAAKQAQVKQFLDRSLVVTVAVLVLTAAVACITAFRLRKLHGMTFGLTAGLSIGLAIFIADAGLVRSGDSLSGQFLTPYPYVAILFAATATAVTQVGFLRGRAVEVVPSVNAAIILTPLILEAIIYRQLPQLPIILLVSIIVAGVLFLSTGAAARAETGEPGETGTG
jgi:drug/metabolite transporter (DMT)-like permease